MVTVSSVKLKLVDIWNSKLQALEECTSTHTIGSQKKERSDIGCFVFCFITLWLSGGVYPCVDTWAHVEINHAADECIRLEELLGRSFLKLVTNYYTTMRTKFKTEVGSATFILNLQDHLPGLRQKQTSSESPHLYGSTRHQRLKACLLTWKIYF
ncbi:hypothetical protein H5410_009259 [Solanum commersonii]|uniref:Uncharacterized protein n=1 Tax=Solanum commersonii TaxID=4109 RepID=A0A9J6AHX3_SOLCO|nr:hypothetical protein H5410_009259 [Solanum commersonii]